MLLLVVVVVLVAQQEEEEAAGWLGLPRLPHPELCFSAAGRGRAGGSLTASQMPGPDSDLGPGLATLSTL